MTTRYFGTSSSPTETGTRPTGVFGEYAPPGTQPIGKANQPVRALAFSGGLFDSAMQLGVAHALLVSRSEPPEVVVGVSTGAINAVALAEVLQAGSGGATEQEQSEAQVARFREVLEAYRQARDELTTALLPDIYQVDARRPLAPTKLPIHSQDERDKRARSAASRYGLIELANDLLRVDVSIASITRGIRAYLGLQAAGEQRTFIRRMAGRILEGYRLWRVVADNIGKLALLGVRVLQAMVAPVFDWMASFSETERVTELLQRPWVRRLRLHRIVKRVAAMLASRGTGQKEGSTAAGLVFRSRSWVSRIRLAGRWLFGFAVLIPVAFGPAASTSALLVAVLDRVTEAAWLARLFPAFVAALPPHAGLFHWRSALLVAVAFAVLSVAYAIALAMLVATIGIDRVLTVYRIEDGIFDPHPIRSWLVRLFDPHYYGDITHAEVVESALTGDDAPTPNANARLLKEFEVSSPAIHVRPMAANVRNGQLEVIDGDVPIVNALLAANALPPLFEAQKCGRDWYIDGGIVANEPTRALVTHLTDRVNDDSTVVDIYPVSSLPLAARELGGGLPSYSGLVNIAARARQLESFRDATLDRRMTTLVSRTVPGNKATWWRGRDAGDPPAEEKFLRANVFPIELDALRSTNDRLLAAKTVDERRELIAEAVADGCRSSLETMLHASLAGAGQGNIKCRAHVVARTGGRVLPGAGGIGDGPGLPEVCSHCALNSANGGVEATQSLRIPATRRPELPLWPVSGQQAPERGVTSRRDMRDDSQRARERAERQLWPMDRESAAPRADLDRPTINLLFSGGVFRGVYLAGVINALNEAAVAPDLIAGSSIGSITAAMAARVFCESDPAARRRRILDVAATYMSVDRIVLTDRFSDFIRNVTLRGAATAFSLRDLDSAFRAFDRTGTDEYGKELRRVLAGLERLFYLSPFEARDLVKAFRMQQYAEVRRLLEAYVQEWLERGAVGIELLGAEPLALLIREHVLRGTDGRGADPAAGFVDELRRSGIQFIATMTNLTRGRLDVTHLPAISAEGEGARTIETLLASSAFPAVFRPRWSWEVDPESNVVEQYIDGGVMDNLPLDAVANFLNDARFQQRVRGRPQVGGHHVPHLVFTGSLEVQRPALSHADTRETARYWRRSTKRAKELKYNNKIDNYASTQEALRRIYEATPASRRSYEPLDLEIVAVKPKWLCGTFAFHPMLGFRRIEQARSIAHGCKTALEKLANVSMDHPEWVKAWGVAALDSWSASPEPARAAQGECWYRKDCLCPFSERGIRSADGENPVKPETRRALNVIYTECRRAKTHQSRG